MSLEFVVPGDPVAWQRAGLGKNGHFTQAKTRGFEKRVRRASGVAAMLARRAEPITGPVLLHVRAFFSPLAESVRRGLPQVLKATRPDVDNISKGVADALNGGVLVDDGQVAILVAEKWHAAGVEDPFTVVNVKPIDEATVAHTCPLCGSRRIA